MIHEKNTTSSITTDSANDENVKEHEQLPVHNPFNKKDEKEITEQDLANEQMFKEAQTERD